MVYDWAFFFFFCYFHKFVHAFPSTSSRTNFLFLLQGSRKQQKKKQATPWGKSAKRSCSTLKGGLSTMHSSSSWLPPILAISSTQTFASLYVCWKLPPSSSKILRHSGDVLPYEIHSHLGVGLHNDIDLVSLFSDNKALMNAPYLGVIDRSAPNMSIVSKHPSSLVIPK